MENIFQDAPGALIGKRYNAVIRNDESVKTRIEELPGVLDTKITPPWERGRYSASLNEKRYSTTTMDIFEFMAKMLYFLPLKHTKMIRYFGIAGTIWTSCPLPAGGHRDRTTPTVRARSSQRSGTPHGGRRSNIRSRPTRNDAPSAVRGCPLPWSFLIPPRRPGTGSGGNARFIKDISGR
jgi:hypothetical protein